MTNAITATTSPFDAIKQVRPDASEYWSARDLMGLLGYDKWERFNGAIERAMVTAQNQGFNVENNFPGAGKPIISGKGREQIIKDYELTRYAAYLVAMNGDPRKPEIASAQSYFAIQTRVAETSQVDEPKKPETKLEWMRAAVEAEEARLALEAENKVLAPKAKAYDTFLDAKGSVDVQRAAQLLTRAGISTGQKRLFSYLDEIKWTSKPMGRSRRAMQTAVDSGYVELKAMSYKHPRTGEVMITDPQIRITPKGLHKLRELLLPPLDINELF